METPVNYPTNLDMLCQSEIVNVKLIIDNIDGIPNSMKKRICQLIENYITCSIKYYYDNRQSDGKISDDIYITKLAVWICLIFTKIKFTYSDDEFEYMFPENHEFPMQYSECIRQSEFKNKKTNRNVYDESLTSKAIVQLVQSRNLQDIEKYVRWMIKTLQLDKVDVISLSILIKHMCDIQDKKLIQWLQTKYDFLIIVLIILIKKLYVTEYSCENKFYADLLRMNIYEINNAEIAFVIHMNLNITKDEYDRYESPYSLGIS